MSRKPVGEMPRIEGIPVGFGVHDTHNDDETLIAPVAAARSA